MAAGSSKALRYPKVPNPIVLSVAGSGIPNDFSAGVWFSIGGLVTVVDFFTLDFYDGNGNAVIHVENDLASAPTMVGEFKYGGPIAVVGFLQAFDSTTGVLSNKVPFTVGPPQPPGPPMVLSIESDHMPNDGSQSVGFKILNITANDSYQIVFTKGTDITLTLNSDIAPSTTVNGVMVYNGQVSGLGQLQARDLKNGAVSNKVDFVLGSVPVQVVIVVTDADTSLQVPNINLLVNGTKSYVTDSSGSATVLLASGTSNIQASGKGYYPESASIIVTQGMGPVNIQMKPTPPVPVPIDCIFLVKRTDDNTAVPKAYVNIGPGAFVTDASGIAKASLKPNQYAVVVTSMGYYSTTTGITVDENNNTFTFLLQAIPPNPPNPNPPWWQQVIDAIVNLFKLIFHR